VAGHISLKPGYDPVVMNWTCGDGQLQISAPILLLLHLDGLQSKSVRSGSEAVDMIHVTVAYFWNHWGMGHPVLGMACTPVVFIGNLQNF
jgi:hypothetical protein